MRAPVVVPRVVAPEVADWQYQNRDKFMRVFTPAALADVYEALLAKARAGDMTAIKLVLSYGVGNPPQSPPQEPTEAEPGSDDKVLEMAGRAGRGEPVFNRLDATFERHRNGDGAAYANGNGSH